jgi:hypothetical protein
MGYFYGNGTWSWLCLIPLLVMLGFMVMMFVMARRWCWMGAETPGNRMAGGVKMQNQTESKWKGMQGSMMQSCMEMMSRRMPPATHDTGMHGAFDCWSKDLEQKILDLLDKKGSVGPSEIASDLGIPEDVAVSLLHRLALEGKVRIGSVEKTK